MKGKGSPDAHLALDFDPAVVSLNDLLGNGESQPRALGFIFVFAHPVELFKEMRDGIVRDPNTSILDFSTNSIGWVEQLRSAAVTASDDKAALLSRTQSSLQNVTAVSLDEELSLLLDLEQSYKASAKLVSTVDEMMSALLQAAG